MEAMSKELEQMLNHRWKWDTQRQNLMEVISRKVYIYMHNKESVHNVTLCEIVRLVATNLWRCVGSFICTFMSCFTFIYLCRLFRTVDSFAILWVITRWILPLQPYYYYYYYYYLYYYYYYYFYYYYYNYNYYNNYYYYYYYYYNTELI